MNKLFIYLFIFLKLLTGQQMLHM